MRSKLGLDDKLIGDYLEALVKAAADIDEIAEEALDIGGEILLDGMKSRAPHLTGTLDDHLYDIKISEGDWHARKVGIDAGKKSEGYGEALLSTSAGRNRHNKKGSIRSRHNQLNWAREYMYFFYQENGSPRNPAHSYIRATFDSDWRKAKAKMIEVFKGYYAKLP